MATNGASDLEQILETAQLPALPQSAMRLLKLSQDPEIGPAEFAVPIEADPGLAGQVLRFVNSSYFGFRQEVSSVRFAISLVGVRTIKNFALWSAVFSLMPNPKCGPFDLRRLWQDSLRRAIFARTVGAKLAFPSPDDLFTAALLQDMALPLLANEMPEPYQELLAARQGGAIRLSALEEDRFGWTHAQAGGVLARRWGLPETFATLIERHVVGGDGDNNAASRDASVVALSGLLASVCDESWSERDRFSERFEQLPAAKTPDLTGLLECVDEEFTEFAPLLKLAATAKPLVDCLEETPHPALA